jgi:hypothetical protein
MMVQTTLVQGASLPYFGLGSDLLSIFVLPPAYPGSISRAPRGRLCSIDLRWAGREPLLFGV